MADAPARSAAQDPAAVTSPWGAIRVRGARENNLRNVDLDIPKRRLTVFTGVSGSGKSSLVFQTIAAESQRLINETYSAFVQGFMPTLARPDVDSLEGLTTAIILDQERMGANGCADPHTNAGNDLRGEQYPQRAALGGDEIDGHRVVLHVS